MSSVQRFKDKSVEYKTYVSQVPKKKRSNYHPVTPRDDTNPSVVKKWIDSVKQWYRQQEKNKKYLCDICGSKKVTVFLDDGSILCSENKCRRKKNEKIKKVFF